jgi:hypothetical protein
MVGKVEKTALRINHGTSGKPCVFRALRNCIFCRISVTSNFPAIKTGENTGLEAAKP